MKLLHFTRVITAHVCVIFLFHKKKKLLHFQNSIATTFVLQDITRRLVTKMSLLNHMNVQQRRVWKRLCRCKITHTFPPKFWFGGR